MLAPASAQEIVDLTILAFDLADKYRNPVMIMGDGLLGQMMEPVSFRTEASELPESLGLPPVIKEIVRETSSILWS